MNNSEQQEKFSACISQAIRLACSRLRNPDGTITYENAKLVVADVQHHFLTTIDTVPAKIAIACNLALASVAPSAMERMMLLKRTLALASGVAGIAAIIAGIGLALGWGSGIISSIIIWITGTSLAGPIGWIASGTALTVITGYFVMKKDMANMIDVFENALIGGITPAIQDIWGQYGTRLASVPRLAA